MSNEKKTKWFNIGSFRTKGKKRLVFNKNVKALLLEDGTQIELDEFKTAFCYDSIDGVRGLAERGIIDQEQLSKRLDLIEKTGTKYDISLSVKN